MIARVARDDPEWDSRLVEPVLAALIHDAGMLHVPADVLKKTDPLSLEDRRVIEAHCRAGAELAGRLGRTPPGWRRRSSSITNGWTVQGIPTA